MPAIKQQYMILLSELLKDNVFIGAEDDREINSVRTDSRLVTENDLFIALPGTARHGLSYLSEIVKAGACCVLFEKNDVEDFQSDLDQYRDKIVQLEVDSIRETAGIVIDRFFVSPSHQMQIVGVTGTDGKTSVTRFIAQTMMPDMKTALIGTTGNGIWGELTVATHTTPDVLSLHGILFDMRNKGASQVVMEVSSHGIDQKRIAGVDIDTAVLTNISRDHLDYHGTVENYRETKKQLFNLSSVKNIVLNLDDAAGCELAESLRSEKNVWAYSLDVINKPEVNCVYAKSIVVQGNGFDVEVVTPSGDCHLLVPLLGRFNISNILSVLCVLLLNKVDLNVAVNRISKLKTAPGRMEMFTANKLPSVVVDYAHTPKALELALQAIAEHCNGSVWCVFGCGGGRDQGKRALMGAVAEKLSDYIVVTDDNPRHEKSSVIIEQILSGFKNKNVAEVISNRKDAIEYACKHASDQDVVLIAGKGHEDYQIVGDKKLPFSDRDEVMKIIGGVK